MFNSRLDTNERRFSELEDRPDENIQTETWREKRLTNPKGRVNYLEESVIRFCLYLIQVPEEKKRNIYTGATVKKVMLKKKR